MQGSPIRASKSSANTNNGFRVAQCYYAANENSKSVALTATQRDPEHLTARTAKDVWEDMFGEEAREKREGKGEREGGEKGAAPTKIDGVGDEAYWTGARFGGALYVLNREKDTFIRISVGGGDTEESKIEKSKALARKASSPPLTLPKCNRTDMAYRGPSYESGRPFYSTYEEKSLLSFGARPRGNALSNKRCNLAGDVDHLRR